MENNLKFRKRLHDIFENLTFSDAYVFDKLSELLAENQHLALDQVKQPFSFCELVENSVSSLKIEQKEFGKALRMKFAAILAALSIGFIAGLTFNPPKTVEIAETQIQLRREIKGDAS